MPTWPGRTDWLTNALPLHSFASHLVVSVFVHYVSQLEPSAQRTHGKHQASTSPRPLRLTTPLLRCFITLSLSLMMQIIANRSDVSLLHYKVPQEVPHRIYSTPWSVSLLVGR